MNAVRKLRKRAGLTQTRLARLGGTSQPTIAAYESGSKSLTLRTIERLAEASGLEVDIRYVPPLTREDRRSIALHRAIVEKLKADPAAVLRRARKTLKRMRTTHPSTSPLIKEWEGLLSLPVGDLAEVLVDVAPHSRDLRQVTPFAGILSAAERKDVYWSFERAAEGRGT